MVSFVGAGSWWELLERWEEGRGWLMEGEWVCQVDSMFEGERLILVEFDGPNRCSCVGIHKVLMWD
jgi:hypothetical protein